MAVRLSIFKLQFPLKDFKRLKNSPMDEHKYLRRFVHRFLNNGELARKMDSDFSLIARKIIKCNEELRLNF
jgi:hypothetical protein